MQDVMTDLETVGTRAGCGILSIGAVEFDPSNKNKPLGKKFYTPILLKSCEEVGLFAEESTMKWWSRQSLEVRKALSDAEDPSSPTLKLALTKFNKYLKSCHNGNKVRVWGNGASFDNAILEAAYAATGVTSGWRFWNSMCYRTLKNLHPEIELDRVGTFHNALDDAISQANHACKIFQAISKEKK